MGKLNETEQAYSVAYPKRSAKGVMPNKLKKNIHPWIPRKFHKLTKKE